MGGKRHSNLLWILRYAQNDIDVSLAGDRQEIRRRALNHAPPLFPSKVKGGKGDWGP